MERVYVKKILSINFNQARAPITALSTKFGGQPVWLEAAQWPLSATTGNPMKFICQIELNRDLYPQAQGKMAYIFMTDEEDETAETWDPEAGENAVIIQPGTLSSRTKVKNVTKGPTLDKEYEVVMHQKEELQLSEEVELNKLEDEALDAYYEIIGGNKIGGTPHFLQGEEYPEGNDWQLLLQLDSSQVPFEINFGDLGTGYVFINKEATVGRFLWQCF